MRVILFLLMIIMIIAKPAFTQTPSKTEIQAKMSQAFNSINDKVIELEKRLVDAKKNKEDPETIKSLEDEITLMKKQLTMMKGVNRGISNMSEKTIKQATEVENLVVPQKDPVRINSLSKKIQTETELTLFIKNVQAGVEKLIPAVERTEALIIYNETKAKYKTTAIVANAASSCWMLGHWEKALFIMGRACLEDVTDADNLNNYASFLIMTGGEQAAIPILEFLNAKYPNNSTILNNLGQAWFGLGDMEKAKKYLGDAIELCPNHSMANATLAKIFSGGSGPDKPKAISYLKASLKASYDPEKEADLAKLGYNTTYDDLPPFNYPMQQDPFNLVKLIQLIPRKLQTDLDDPEPAYAGQEFINGVEEFYKELNEEDVDLEKQVHDRASKLITDIPFQQKFLEAHNCPAHLLAARSVLLINAENIHSASPFLAQLWMPYTIVSGNGSERPLPPEVLIQQCMDFWEKEVSEPIRLLAAALHNDLVKAGDDCEVMNALYIAYLDRRAKFYNDGVDHIQNEFIQKSKRLQAWIFLNLYAIEDVPPKKTGNYTYTLVNRLPELVAKQRYQNKNYESMLHFMEWGKEYYDHHTSACKDKTSLNRLMGAQNIKQYKVKELRCEYQKVFRTPVDYVIELKCNTMTEITNSKLKKRNSNVDKASVESSKPKLKNIPGPLMQAIKKGPNNFPGEIEETQSTNQFAPLTAENKELSQFSFEYNKAGNLVGLNFQLNEDGTTLKDPDSIESGVDSRWCWNARASAKKGYMNKLLMK